MTSINQPLRPNEHISSQRAKELFRQIRTTSEISKQDLLARCNMRTSTLNRTLDELLLTQIITESRLGSSTGGRKPILYQVNARYGCVVGLDISKPIARLVLADMTGLVCASAQYLSASTLTPDDLISWVVEQIQLWKQQYINKFKYWIGLGIGVFGIIDRTSGTINQLEWYREPCWSNVAIVTQLEQRLGIPVLLNHGVNSCIIAEVWANKANQDEKWLYVHADSSIRCAMLLDGKLFFEISQIEGSLAQMIIQADGHSYREDEGHQGCLDSYASAYAIQREANDRLFMGAESLIKQQLASVDQEVQLAHILEAAELQDATASDLLRTAAHYLGIGLANLLNILHPDKVIIGGALADNHLYYQTAVNSALSHIYQHDQYQVSFARGSLGEQSLAIGSALFVLEQLI